LTQCVVEDGILMEPGSVRQTDDGCGKLTCQTINGEASLKEEKAMCGPLPPDCKPEHVQYDADGCCKVCRQCTELSGQRYEIGSQWQRDNCTTCHCSENGEVECEKTVCEKKVCPPRYKVVTVQGSGSSCCPVKECVHTTQNCTDLVEPECKEDQQLKRITDMSECPTLVCVCLPADQCNSDAPSPHDLLPGEEWQKEEGGCCPRYIKRCVPSTCPSPLECRADHQRVTIDNNDRCCPDYKCEKLNKCFYQAKNGDNSSTVYNIGDEWQDGPCTKCNCVSQQPNSGSSGSYGPAEDDTNIDVEAICTVETCEERPIDDWYVLVEVQVDKCCPVWRKSACQDGGVIYQIGDGWRGSDPCDEYSCVLANGEALIKHKQTYCNQTCQKGSVYKAVTGECCGECEETQCVAPTGELLSPGDLLEISACTKLTCYKSDNKILLREVSTVCPPLDPDCPEDSIEKDSTGCCQVCNRKQSSCSIEPIEENTIGLIHFFDLEHGNCSNVASIPGLTECSGTCSSGSKYNKRLGEHVSACTCCQSTSEKMLYVNTLCTDGAVVVRTISVPNSCSCEACLEMQTEQPEVKDVDSVGPGYNSNPAARRSDRDRGLAKLIRLDEPISTDQHGVDSSPAVDSNQAYSSQDELSNQGYSDEQSLANQGYSEDHHRDNQGYIQNQNLLDVIQVN